MICDNCEYSLGEDGAGVHHASCFRRGTGLSEHPTDHKPRPVRPPQATNAFCARCGYFPLPLEDAHPIPWDWPLLDPAGRAVQDDGLDVARLRQCPSIMVILNRYGTFNDAWWGRLADEYAGAAPPLHDPTP